MPNSPFRSCPAFLLAILFVTGVIAGDFFLVSFLSWGILTLVLCIGGVLLMRVHRPSMVIVPSASVVFLLLGVSLGGLRVSSVTEQRTFIPDSLLRGQRDVVGLVAGFPSTVGNQTRVLVDLEAIEGLDVASDGGVRMMASVRALKRDSTDVQIRYGDRVRLRGVLSRPSLERNPGEFNQQTYYDAQGISYLLLVRGRDNVQRIDSAKGSWLMTAIVDPVCRYMHALIEQTTHGEARAFLKGILVGDRSEMSFSTRVAFAHSGVAHVLAVSGAHVAVLAAILFFCGELFRIPMWGRVLLSSSVLVLYMLVTGSNPPVVRATIMGITFLVGKLTEEKVNSLNLLGVAALVILLINPHELHNIGFQLSFAAVSSIIYLYPIVDEMVKKIRVKTLFDKFTIAALRLSVLTIIATLGTLPFTALSFGKVSIVGIAANIVVMPAVGLGLSLGFLTMVTGVVSSTIAEGFGALNDLLLSTTLMVTKFAGALPFAYVETYSFRPIDSLPFYAGVAVVFHLKRKGAAKRLLILFLLTANAAVFYPARYGSALSHGKMRMNFIDVGQGDAILVDFPDRKKMLIDAGPRTQEYDAGKFIVDPFLKRQRISGIDFLVVTHPHGDHIGGVPHILREFRTATVVESGDTVISDVFTEYELTKKKTGVRVVRAEAGMTLNVADDLRLYVLHPQGRIGEEKDVRRKHNVNNSSVVLKLCYRDFSVLFVGDIEQEVERRLIEKYGDFLHSTMLKVGHHGSNTSSSLEFLDYVRPEYAVVSVGRNNKFRHPSPHVINRLQERIINYFRTDEEGAAMFETDGSVHTYMEWR